jgi:nucleoside-diphosphate kinase
MHLHKEKTLVIIKPDGVQRSMIGEVIKRLERIGLKLVAIDMMVPNEKQVRSHYLIDPDWKRKAGQKSIEAYEKKGMIAPISDAQEAGDRVLNNLVRYMTSGPVVAMVWQGAHSVQIVRKIIGGTEPLTSDVGTIRGDFVLDSYQMSDLDSRSVRNLIHASGTSEEAENEIKIWFAPEKIINYRLIQEQILYDVNLDGYLE